MSISLILVIAALILTIVYAATGKIPLWVSVLLVELALLIPGLPLK